MFPSRLPSCRVKLVVHFVSPKGIDEAVARGLQKCCMAVIFGTSDYGENTGVSGCTLDELRYIQNNNKPFVLLKMCRKFDNALTELKLPNDLLSTWFFPNDHGEWVFDPAVVEAIVAKFTKITNTSSRLAKLIVYFNLFNN